jgi:hypothetical protein
MKNDPEKLRPKNDFDDKKRFWEIVEQMIPPGKLSKHDKLCLRKRVLYLSGKEYRFYKELFYRDSLTPPEMQRWKELGLLDKYFPIEGRTPNPQKGKKGAGYGN